MTGRPQTLTSRNVRHWYAIVHQVLPSFSVLTSVCHIAKLLVNPLWNVKPVQLRITRRPPTLISVCADTTRSSV